VVKKNVMITRGTMDFAARDRPWVAALYDAEIRRLDVEFFGRLRRTLAETGLADNTVVVVSADHGEELLDRDLVGHISTFQEARLYDEITRIPLVFWSPGILPAGRIVTEPVQCIDIMPTLLELTGTPIPGSVQGHSLLPLIEGRPGWQPKPLFFESSSGGYTADGDQYRRRILAVRTERWKLIDNAWEGSYELYDLKADSLERDNALDQYPEVADSLRSLLNKWVLYAGPRTYREPDVVPDEIGDMQWRGPPQILLPQDGDTLHYQGAERAIKLGWTGPVTGDYAIEYDVGVGTYHLAGEISEERSSPVYGPFQANFWNSLVLYNPWKFRVYLRSQPEAKSEWIHFNLASTQGGEAGFSFSLLLLGTPAALAGIWNHSYKLGAGLSHGAIDLYFLVAAVGAADLSAYALILTLLGGVLAPVCDRLGRERSLAWGWALGYIAFVYATIPVLPQVWGALADYTEGSVRYLGIAVVALVGIGLGLGVWRRVRGRRWQGLLALAIIAPVYGYFLYEYAHFPAERLHLVEYGCMGYVLFRALRFDLGPIAAYLASFALAVLIGIGDECIQWVLPQRFFEVKDIQLNAFSAALGLLLVRFVVDPGGGDDRI
jgi:VanZ family protein